jgi:hypothetical protein
VHADSIDPVAFRFRVLNWGRAQGRLAAERGRRRASPDRGRCPPRGECGMGRVAAGRHGLSCRTSFGQERDMPTWIACAAPVQVNRASGAVTLKKPTLMVDAGTIVHSNGALAQVEGGFTPGVEPRPTRGLAVREGPARGHQPRHPYADANEMCPKSPRVPAEDPAAHWPWRAGDDSCRTGNRQRGLRGGRGAPAADSPGSGAADHEREDLIHERAQDPPAAERLREAVFADLVRCYKRSDVWARIGRGPRVTSAGELDAPSIDLRATIPSGRRASAKARAFVAFAEAFLT